MEILNRMFKVNDYVDHKHCGVCLIKDIAVLSGDASGTQYYVLEPLFGEDKGTILRVPVTNSSSLSNVMSKKDALKLVQSWPALGDFYEMDSKKRKLAYESAISGGDLSMLAPLLEGIKQRKLREGHLNSMDQQFLNRAEPILFGELSVALGIHYEDVDVFIRDHAKSA
jgi:RNA polymerase-interacting CarD/CdnL/TRCF family regulator